MFQDQAWADAFGTWCASVQTSGCRADDATRARKLIVAALSERESNYDASTLHITRVGVAGGIATYRELP